MKALKIIANAIEKELHVSAKDCFIYFQGTNYGESKKTTVTAAIVGINASKELYKIRVWHDIQHKPYCRLVEDNEVLIEAFKKFLCL